MLFTKVRLSVKVPDDDVCWYPKTPALLVPPRKPAEDVADVMKSPAYTFALERQRQPLGKLVMLLKVEKSCV